MAAESGSVKMENFWRQHGCSASALLRFHLPELQAEAIRLGLRKSGRKGELVDRIHNCYIFGPHGTKKQLTTQIFHSPALLAENHAQVQAIIQSSNPNLDGNCKSSSMDDSANTSKFQKDEAVEILILNRLNDLLVIDLGARARHDWCCHVELESIPLVKIYGNYLKFPCDEAAACQLMKKFCTPSPYDSGDQSILDIAVCNSGQICAENGALKIGIDWEMDSRQNSLLESFRRILAPDCPVISAKLDKLCVYASGCFFKPHVDRRIHAYHFASMVVCLPCQYLGGEFVVRNNNTTEQRTFYFPAEREGSLKCNIIAFLIDCEQEVKLVLHGARLLLNYHLFYHEKAAANIPCEAPSLNSVSGLSYFDRLLADAFFQLFSLPKWTDRQVGIVCREAGYNLANLKPIDLQGNDRAIYNALSNVSALQVKLLPIKQCGRQYKLLQNLPQVSTLPSDCSPKLFLDIDDSLPQVSEGSTASKENSLEATVVLENLHFVNESNIITAESKGFAAIIIQL